MQILGYCGCVRDAGYPHATHADVIEGKRGGFGKGLIAVLGLSEEEKWRIAYSLRDERFSNRA